MPTVNTPITAAWTKIADASNTELLVTCTTESTVEFVTTTADVAPVTTMMGHQLVNEDALTRGVIGSGFVWARLVAGSHPPSTRLVVTK